MKLKFLILIFLALAQAALAQNDIKLNRNVGTKRNGDNAVLETTRTGDKDRLHVIVHNPDGSNVASSGATTSGAQHALGTHVTASTSAATLVIARPTRRTCLIRNEDGAINVRFGPATVTGANGTLLKPGESVSITAVTLWQVIADSGSPVVSVMDEYD